MSLARARARQPLPEQVDVAIIGAGLGGLTAGAALARSGLSVAVFDAHYVAGGCCTTFARGSDRGKYHFDVGLHYVGDSRPGGRLPQILEPLGVDLDYLPLDPDGFDTLVFPDFELKVPADVDLYRQRLLDLFPEERKGIDRYVRFLWEVDGLAQRFDESRGKMTVRNAWEVARRGRMVLRYQHATIAQVLDSCTENVRLRGALLGQNGDYGVAPSQASALLHGGLVMHYVRGGAYYPRGGGQVIADGLAARIEEAGGTVHLRKPIGRVLIEDGAAVGVETEPDRHGETRQVRARVVISNADIKLTLERLVGPAHLPRSWVRRAADFQMAGAIFMTFLGVEGDLRRDGMRNANYWCFDGYDFDAFYAEGLEARRPIVKGCYITSASLKDPGTPTHAPAGVTNVEVMALVPGDPAIWGVEPGAAEAWSYKRDETYRALEQQVEDELVQRLDRQFPGTAARVVYRESASPLTHARYTRASGGTGYGLAATPEQYMEKRPGFRTPVRNLYLAGASTRAGHGVLGTLLSGRNCAGCVARDLGRS